MDGEFTKLTVKGIDFLSLALIKPTGEELYLELEQDPSDVDQWVKENVMPYLTNQKVSLVEAKERIRTFVGDSKPYLIADVNQFDWMGICKLFGIWNVPFFYIPIDFATILWNKEIDPDINREQLAAKYGIDTSCFKKHNALDDTRVLKSLYEKIYQEGIC